MLNGVSTTLKTFIDNLNLLHNNLESFALQATCDPIAHLVNAATIDTAAISALPPQVVPPQVVPSQAVHSQAVHSQASQFAAQYVTVSGAPALSTQLLAAIDEVSNGLDALQPQLASASSAFTKVATLPLPDMTAVSSTFAALQRVSYGPPADLCY